MVPVASVVLMAPVVPVVPVVPRVPVASTALEVLMVPIVPMVPVVPCGFRGSCDRGPASSRAGGASAVCGASRRVLGDLSRQRDSSDQGGPGGARCWGSGAAGSVTEPLRAVFGPKGTLKRSKNQAIRSLSFLFIIKYCDRYNPHLTLGGVSGNRAGVREGPASMWTDGHRTRGSCPLATSSQWDLSPALPIR